MRIAFITRPRWQLSAGHAYPSARLIDAPLQELSLCQPNPEVFKAICSAAHPWTVLTSPAAVEAMDRWVNATAINPMQIHKMRLAAVGSGTRQAIADLVARSNGNPLSAWPVQLQAVVTAADDTRADAASLLVALDQLQQQEGFVWQDQTMLLAEGANNRPTLAAGLAERGAHVIVAAMYRRNDVTWPDSIWQMLAKAKAGECGVVVTSSGVIERLIADLGLHGLGAQHLVWCTQHAAIAKRLYALGVQEVRRVALDSQALQADLFERSQYWEKE